MCQFNARQIRFVDERQEMFENLPLNSKNRLVKHVHLIPRSRVEEEYRKNFKRTRGQDLHPFRLALVILIVKEKLFLSDRETVEELKETPYIRYFMGDREYKYDVKPDPSMLTRIRKRFPADVIAQTNEWIVNLMLYPDEDNTHDDGSGAGGRAGEEESGPSEIEDEGCIILDPTHNTGYFWAKTGNKPTRNLKTEGFYR